ncbi:hypothetical protein BCF55_1666 [Hydrogenivirga caldilitoris]|uniref:Uncharacterized protein n=1 Tax=Hydrogenivirga caldilitoris TaxID=246264 RepID=A0A497XQW6_9AQUI|nr:ATP synthase subunit I [Hydrogenivirga caldilitoris]RLJ71366.1 hypothetical protein BCF55_1666 [Hydrogenivirga caldilitoris]
MEFLLSFTAGILTGLLYNEHIYRQATNFPKSNPLKGFWLRLTLTGLVALVIAKSWGAQALLTFVAGNLLARLVHTFLRGFPVVRY